jgi:NADH:quinone reductase (non-electrogenic)
LRDLDGLEASPSGQLVVRPTLQTTRDDNVFAMGDCAWLVPDGETRPIPPRAQAAHQQASHLLRQLERRLEGKPVEPFVYHDFGSLVSLGNYQTVGQLMGFISSEKFRVEGWIAKFVYISLYRQHIWALHGFWRMALDTVSRWIRRQVDPKVKLH